MSLPAWLDAVASRLLADFGSPLYVYDAEGVRTAYRAFAAAFPYAPVDLHYAIVCNKNPHLVRVLHALGAGIHANTPGDAFAALEAGVPASRITYSGTNLDAADLAFLVGQNISLNLDSLDQLRLRAAFRRGSPEPRDGGTHVPAPPEAVGLRLLVDEEASGGRIGVTAAELPEALAIAAGGGLTLAGLHMYAGTNTLSADRILACLDRMIAASHGLPDLAYLDLGGGFGLPYKEGRAPLDLKPLGAEVSGRMEALSSERGRRIRLVIEPGRVLVGEAGALLATVVSVKERGGRRFVGVDASVANLAAESVYHPHHQVAPLLAARREAPEKHPEGPARNFLEIPTDVCGNTTHSRDFLAKGRRLPELRPGDRLAVLDVGAYGYAMASHFLNRPRPAEVVLDGGAAILTTRRETMEDLLTLTRSGVMTP